MREIVVENFESQIANGMAVYDANGDRIGTVQQYDLTNGWFQTEKGVLFPRDRYIPFSAIDRIGPNGIYLSVTTAYVNDMYDEPPFVNVDVVVGPAGAAAVGPVSSRYDGSRWGVDGTRITRAIQRVGKGPKVYGWAGKGVGRVYQYDRAGGWMEVEKGMFSPKDLFIPVTAVDYLDNGGVHLRVTTDVLKNAFVVQPTTVTFVSTTI